MPCIKTCLRCGQPTRVLKNQRRGSVVLGGERSRRCKAAGCRYDQHLLSGSPVFKVGRGADTPSLRKQVLVLHGIAWGVQPHIIRAQCGLTADHIEEVQKKWRETLKAFVVHVQEKLKVGGPDLLTESR